MQRVTITLDDDLLETLDSLSQRRGYNNRSEAIRDILRSALAQEATQQHGTQGFAVLSYVYEHEKRDLASRIVSTQHHHHDLSVATLHVHINHDDCLEIAVLKGDMGDVQHFADDVIAQRGVRHGHLQCLPKECDRLPPDPRYKYFLLSTPPLVDRAVFVTTYLMISWRAPEHLQLSMDNHGQLQAYSR